MILRALLGVVTVAIGGAGLLAFAFLLVRGAPGWVHLGLSTPAALAFDAGLALVFFVQHSGMVRRRVRRALARAVPESGLGAAYTVASGLVLLGLVGLWQPVDAVAWSLTGAAGLAIRAVFGAAVLGMLWGARAVGAWDLLGLRALRDGAGRGSAADAELTIRGPYRCVRHPLYFLSLVLIWAVPHVTVDRLLFDVLFTVWIALACRWEEADLVARFGAAYEDYRARVPMLLPRPWRRPCARR